MNILGKLVKRNIKLFFKDKGLFFSSLITPLILLVLYSTFLAKVYRDSFMSGLNGFPLDEKIIDGIVGGELFSSLLAVSCITVAFCSNMLMVQDKVSGAIDDLLISPVRKSTLALSYYISTFVSTFIVCFIAMIASLIYIAIIGGWCFAFIDIIKIFIDIILLVLFGTSLSTLINFFLTSQGQISAVGTIVSSIYGFICGAYMPISSFNITLQRIIMFLPGTYGTSLIRNHAMEGAFDKMVEAGVPKEVVSEVMKSIDCNIYFFDHHVSILAMYLVLIITIIVIVSIYVLLNVKKKAKKN